MVTDGALQSTVVVLPGFELKPIFHNVSVVWINSSADAGRGGQSASVVSGNSIGYRTWTAQRFPEMYTKSSVCAPRFFRLLCRSPQFLSPTSPTSDLVLLLSVLSYSTSYHHVLQSRRQCSLGYCLHRSRRRSMRVSPIVLRSAYQRDPTFVSFTALVRIGKGGLGHGGHSSRFKREPQS